MPLLLILACAAFVSAFSIRMIDPLVPAIARDFVIPLDQAALLATAFTFPYALSQPILGPLGDAIGKARVIKGCLAVMGAMLVLATIAPTYETLFAARMIAGIAGGGIIPVAFAIIGDRFQANERQVALSRLVMASQISILLGSLAGGVVAANYGWRWMFAAPAAGVIIVFFLSTLALKPRADAKREPMSFARTRRAYTDAFTGPYARICLVGVFVGGSLMFGLTPFIAGRIQLLGLGGLKESGIVIGAMSVGGLTFTLLVRLLLSRITRATMTRIGGTILASALVLYAVAGSWQLEASAFVFVGFGFFMMHNCLQALGTELAPNARASGISLMAFIFFLGQAAGPIVYSYAFHHFGLIAPIIASAAVFAVMSWWVSWRLGQLDRAAAAAALKH